MESSSGSIPRVWEAMVAYRPSKRSSFVKSAGGAIVRRGFDGRLGFGGLGPAALQWVLLTRVHHLHNTSNASLPNDHHQTLSIVSTSTEQASKRTSKQAASQRGE